MLGKRCFELCGTWAATNPTALEHLSNSFKLLIAEFGLKDVDQLLSGYVLAAQTSPDPAPR